MARPDPPLIAGRIHGVRAWAIGLTDGTAVLRGHRDEPWAAGGKPTVARCLSGRHRRRVRVVHRPPVADCSCGLYALHPHADRGQGMLGFSRVARKRAGAAFPEAVVGVVEAWGRTELHADGFRAQFARPHTLALIGPSRDSDVGDLIVRLARRYGADLVELESAEELAEYCRERSLGLDPATVRSLLPDDPPADLPAPAGPTGTRPQGSPSRHALAERLGTIAMVIVAVLWYAAIGAFGVAIAVGVIRALVEPSPVEFPTHHLRIVDQALVEVGDGLRYVAVVRNTSQKRLALAAFPSGSVLDQSGERVVGLGERAQIETRPSLPPGATGLIVDVLPGRRTADLSERLRYEVEIRARRAPSSEDAAPPLRLSNLSFDRDRCRVAVTADASRSLQGAGVGIVARDRDDAIRAGGSLFGGRLERGRSREVVFDGERSDCPAWWQRTELYPQLLPVHLAQP